MVREGKADMKKGVPVKRVHLVKCLVREINHMFPVDREYVRMQSSWRDISDCKVA